MEIQVLLMNHKCDMLVLTVKSVVCLVIPKVSLLLNNIAKLLTFDEESDGSNNVITARCV